MRTSTTLLFLLLLFPFTLLSKEKNSDDSVITLASDNWHSLTMPDGSGLYFDIIRYVFEPAGITVKLVMVPYARSVSMVETKEVDGWVASFMDEQPFPLYPEWHFDQNRQIVVSLKDAKKKFTDMESLRGASVVWLRNFNLDKYIPVPLTFEEIDEITGLFPMLEALRAEFFIGAESDIMSAVESEKIDTSKFRFDFLMNLKLYLAFADTERGRKFKKIWDERMEEVHNDPELHEIYRKYGYPIPLELP